VVIVHYVLSERSRGIVGTQELQWMEPTGILINTSLRPLVDKAALLDTLRHRPIRGATLNVFNIESLPANSLWWSED
jgi:phosphoglycerate dehydrogenase-like enzyme